MFLALLIDFLRAKGVQRTARMLRFCCEAKFLDCPAPFAHLSVYENRIWASGTPDSLCTHSRARGSRVFVPTIVKSELHKWQNSQNRPSLSGNTQLSWKCATFASVSYVHNSVSSRSVPTPFQPLSKPVIISGLLLGKVDYCLVNLR